MADDYEVGRGKTPKHTRWKKGQSGNPAGRPRKSRRVAIDTPEELRAMFIATANEKVATRFRGQSVKMTVIHAIFFKLLEKALAGDHRSIKLVMDWTKTEIAVEDEARIRLMEFLLQGELYEEEQARRNHNQAP